MEIERKYLLDQLPENLTSYPCKKIEQGYLSTEPVVRIRRSDDEYYLTYKSKGLMVREEYNLPLTRNPTCICGKRQTAFSSQKHAICCRLPERI